MCRQGMSFLRLLYRMKLPDVLWSLVDSHCYMRVAEAEWRLRLRVLGGGVIAWSVYEIA